MRVVELLAQSATPVFSFEFFPPRGESGEASLFRAVQSLKSLSPGFVSVTYGAGGSTHTMTVEWASRIRAEAGCEAVVHQTAMGLSRDQIDSTLEAMDRAGLVNILALRGDPPTGGGPVTSAFTHADELIAYVRSQMPGACILAACHPEGHAEAANRNADLDNLKRKVDAGADVLISQLFFDNRLFFDFLGRARSKGVTVPILPGIMPVQNVEQVKRFTTMCGASVPSSLMSLLDLYRDTPRAVFYIGVAQAIAQAQDLLDHGVPGVHFYTLNKSPATRLVVEALRDVR